MSRFRDEMEPDDLLFEPGGRSRRAREKLQSQPPNSQRQDHAHLPSSSNKPHFQDQPHPAHIKAHDHDQPQQAHPQLEAQQAAATPYRYPIKAHASRKTSPFAWCAAIICAIMSSAIIIGGILVLIVYLVFRPKIPKFDVSSVTLNGAYLDSGAFLNADLTILANFTNPNKRIDVTFHYIVVDLYFKGTLVATQGVGRFFERAGESTLRAIHMVSSEVALTRDQAEEWIKEVGGSDRVKMEVKGQFLTTSDFVGIFLHFTYVLHVHCDLAIGRPPSGVLLSSNCTTKR